MGMAGSSDKAPDGTLQSSREQRWLLRPLGKCRQFLLLPVLVALALMLLLVQGNAQCGPTVGGFTQCSSTTTSGSATVSVPSNGPLANALQQALNGPNGTLVGNALVQLLGPGAVSLGSVSISFT